MTVIVITSYVVKAHMLQSNYEPFEPKINKTSLNKTVYHSTIFKLSNIGNVNVNLHSS